MKLVAEIRIGQGFDVHRLVAGRKLILGGVEIEFERGLDGHSDADVVLHALMDALLGAAARGDIGQHFPPSDETYRDADSGDLLRKVRDIVAAAGFPVVINVDLTVMAERPKLAPWVTAIRSRIAELLEIDIERVSLKATTTERLGFTGREEGIAALAVCLISER